MPAKTAVPQVEFSNTETPKKTRAQKAVPAKKVAKKAPAKKVDDATPAKTKTTGKRAVSTTTKGKTKVVAKESKARGGQGLPRVLGEHGFVIGSDSATIADILLEGGMTRKELNAKVNKVLGAKKTRNGNPPNVSSLTANVLRRLKEQGYTIEETWALVPPTPASKAAATRAAKKRAAASEAPSKPAKKAPAKKAVAKPATGKTVAKKKVAKRPAKK